MKKAIIIAAITISLALSFQVSSLGIPSYSYNIADEDTQDSNGANEDLNENTEEVGLVYLNTEMDFFTFIAEPGWYYESYDYMTIFYNSYSACSYNSIAVSSYINPISEEDRIAQTAYYMEQVTANLEQIVEGLSITRTENFVFGEFEAYRYYFTGHYVPDNVDIAGEYMYWWIDDREYTCSLFSTADEYDDFARVMYDMLNNFLQTSTMN